MRPFYIVSIMRTLVKSGKEIGHKEHYDISFNPCPKYTHLESIIRAILFELSVRTTVTNITLKVSSN